MLKNYYSLEPIESLLKNPNTLAVIGHNSGTISTKVDSVSSGLVRLQEQDLNEVWETAGDPIVSGVSKECHWRHSSDFLFVSTAATLVNGDYATAAQTAYARLLEFIQTADFKHPIRFWNYMPAINCGEGDLEKYRQFCTGRFNGFQESNYKNNDFPAASAVGHHAQDLLVYVICSKKPGVHHKNKLQIDAYEYPKQYGKTSPSFARATSLIVKQQNLFFISGTASILGHATVFEGDLLGQIKTTENNLLQLLKQAQKNRTHIQTMKVYIRHPEDFSTTEKYLDDVFPECQKVYLHADICRSDLLIEIECFCI